MHKLCEYIDRELDELEDKVARDGKLTRAEIEDGKNLAKFKMALLTNDAMERGESGTYPIHSERRDMRGRYTREDARDSFIDDVRDIMRKAPDEHTKKRTQAFIRELENA